MQGALRKSAAGLAPLETKLASFAPLTPEDFAPLWDIPAEPSLHSAGFEFPEPTAARLVTSGWMGLVESLPNGRRQILQIAIPGDLVAIPPYSGGCIMALTTARSIDATPIIQRIASDDSPRGALRQTWELAQKEAERNLMHQLVRLGSLTAYERIANLIVELVRRHERAGLQAGRCIPWPITQDVLSHIIGLSMVHANRVLQQLRSAGLIELRVGVLVVCDAEALAIAGMAEAPG